MLYFFIGDGGKEKDILQELALSLLLSRLAHERTFKSWAIKDAALIVIFQDCWKLREVSA